MKNRIQEIQDRFDSGYYQHADVDIGYILSEHNRVHTQFIGLLTELSSYLYTVIKTNNVPPEVRKQAQILLRAVAKLAEEETK